ncbi:MAG: hypothetical protein AAFY71_15920 [Bacteroidota bacterium]
MKNLHYLLLLTLLIIPSASWGQGKGGPLRVSLGWTGMIYKGDLTLNEGQYARMYPGGNLALQFANHRKFRMRFNAGFGKVVEQVDQISKLYDNNRITNSYFETNLFYIDLRLMRYFWRKGPIHPYVGIGPSLLFFNPRDAEGNFLIDNIFTREAGEEYATTIFVWPATLGFSVPVSKRLSISTEYVYRLNVSDYIDNIGILGEDPGKDQLHTVQVSVDINLIGKPIESKPSSPPQVRPDVLAVADERDNTSREGRLRNKKVKKSQGIAQQDLVLQEIDYILYQEEERIYRIPRGEVFFGDESLINEELEKEYYGELKEVALSNKWYRSIKLNNTLAISALCRQYRLSPEEWKQLNPSLADPVLEGKDFLVPDYERAENSLKN